MNAPNLNGASPNGSASTLVNSAYRRPGKHSLSWRREKYGALTGRCPPADCSSFHLLESCTRSMSDEGGTNSRFEFAESDVRYGSSADIEAKSARCPLYPRKRTLTSASCPRR